MGEEWVAENCNSQIPKMVGRCRVGEDLKGEVWKGYHTSMVEILVALSVTWVRNGKWEVAVSLGILPLDFYLLNGQILFGKGIPNTPMSEDTATAVTSFQSKIIFESVRIEEV